MTAASILAPVKFCNKCQCETERNKDGSCKSCASIRMSKYYLENKNRINAQASEWRLKNKEDVKSSSAEWRANNKEKIKAKGAARYAEKTQQIRLQMAAYYKANSEALKIQAASWRVGNGHLVRIYSHNRRARENASGFKLSTSLSEKLFTLQRGKCACCGLPLGDKYHLDHIMPLALGGTNTDNNIQLLRQRCNQQKHAKHPIDFMQSRGFLL